MDEFLHLQWVDVLCESRLVFVAFLNNSRRNRSIQSPSQFLPIAICDHHLRSRPKLCNFCI